jgi:hypothetical protein
VDFIKEGTSKKYAAAPRQVEPADLTAIIVFFNSIARQNSSPGATQFCHKVFPPNHIFVN